MSAIGCAWVCRPWLKYHLPISVCAGGLSEVRSGGLQEKQKDEHVH